MNRKRVALVSGGNRGIGLAIVEGLAEQGMTVLLGCRDLAEGQGIAKTLTGDVQAVELDLATQQSVERCIGQISFSYPLVDILINNAAILDDSEFSDLTYDKLVESMHVNTFAPFLLSQHFGALMAKNGYGRIVNVSSGWGASSGLLDSPPAYGLSKSTLNALTRITAQANSGNVKVNVMCPGWVKTRMGGAAATRTPFGAAKTALWLANLEDDGPTGKFFRDNKEIDW
ncbi:SDR family NAD(P)-dependent oxidoreductase [Alteromonadaceae bacterium M269]|nr:SDR family NAD(P)-dependent oxidoreductase [Alteromonadaceae bacterium M269]